MKISIVTISFNQRDFLKECIDSVLNQDICDVEYIIVDPGSTDGSRELIESYGDQVIKVFQKDDGPADGLNLGFKHATGDIFGFINSDDFLLPGALQTVTSFFARQPKNVFATGAGFTADVDKPLKRIVPTVLTKRSMLYLYAVMFQQGTFFPAEMFRAVNGFNDKNKTCWDYELFLRFLWAGATHKLIDQDLAVFRLHQGSISGSGRLEPLFYQEVDTLFFEFKQRRRHKFDKLHTLYRRGLRKFFTIRA